MTQEFRDPARPSRTRSPAPMAMTAALLAGLLREDERYRRVWRARMDRTPTGEVQQSAVARVLAEHLWETGQVEERDEALPRRLKDTVARALSGRHLSPRTLRLFVDAFEMQPVHQALLWAYLEREVGRERPPGREPASPGPSGGAARHAGGPVAWQTVSLHAVNTVDEHGAVRQRVLHVVRALEPVPAISVPLATPAASVVGHQGAHVTDRPGRQPADVVGLSLAEELGAQDTAVLDYEVVPAGEGPATRAVTLLPSLSPGATAVVEVRFHPARLPRGLWWWQDLDDEVVDEGKEPAPPVRVRLGPDAAAHRVLTTGHAGATVTRGVAGFRWGW